MASTLEKAGIPVVNVSGIRLKKSNFHQVTTDIEAAAAAVTQSAGMAVAAAAAMTAPIGSSPGASIVPNMKPISSAAVREYVVSCRA
jgi:hypothetical protein